MPPWVPQCEEGGRHDGRGGGAKVARLWRQRAGQPLQLNDRAPSNPTRAPLCYPQFWNMLEDLKGKIRVYARVRPIAASEAERGCVTVLSVPDSLSLELRTAGKEPKNFTFDSVFGVESTQEQARVHQCVWACVQPPSAEGAGRGAGGAEEYRTRVHSFHTTHPSRRRFSRTRRVSCRARWTATTSPCLRTGKRAGADQGLG